MVDFLLKEDGDFLLLETGDKLILEEGVAVVEGGGSGGSTTSVGAKSLAQKQMEELRRRRRQQALGERPKIKLGGESVAKLQIITINKSLAKLQTEIHATSRAKLKTSPVAGLSVAQLQTKLEGHSDVTIRTAVRGLSEAYVFDAGKTDRNLRKLEKFAKLMELATLYHSLESIDNMQAPTKPRFKTFQFHEDASEWEDVVKTEVRFRAFTGSSSFVGNVRYDNEKNEMVIILSGKEYTFCDVPERIFDAFEGADSKGAYFNRIIKNQFNC